MPTDLDFINPSGAAGRFTATEIDRTNRSVGVLKYFEIDHGRKIAAPVEKGKGGGAPQPAR